MQTGPSARVLVMDRPESFDSGESDLFYGFLSQPEHGRYDQMGSESRRREYLLGHGLARIKIAQAVGESGGEANPTRLPLVFSEVGKPRLDLPPWHVSISHSPSRIGVALAARPVGLDLEPIGSVRNMDGVAQSNFTANETRDLQSLDGNKQHRFAFLRAWRKSKKGKNFDQFTAGDSFEFRRHERELLFPW